MTTKRLLVLVLILILLLLDAIDQSASTAPPSSQMPCAEEVVSMSPCLASVAAQSDGGAMEPSTRCCANFFAAVDGAWSGPACLCHLLRQPLLLGFPVNGSLISSLFPSCGRSADDAAAFQTLCKGVRMLPPLHDVDPVASIETEAPSPEPTAHQPLIGEASSRTTTVEMRKKRRRRRRANNGGRGDWAPSIHMFSWIPIALLFL